MTPQAAGVVRRHRTVASPCQGAGCKIVAHLGSLVDQERIRQRACVVNRLLLLAGSGRVPQVLMFVVVAAVVTPG